MSHTCQFCLFPCNCGRPGEHTCKGCAYCQEIERLRALHPNAGIDELSKMVSVEQYMELMK
jgi:hypothetical protein